MNAVVIGARGALGRHVCAQLAARGHRVTAQPRDEEVGPADVIVNCAGASMNAGLRGWRGYSSIDVAIGMRAIAAAKKWSARLVYVGVHHPPELRACAYVAAHERVADAMKSIDGCVVRATGFYAVFRQFMHGPLVDVGSGRARTNPIDERELAVVVADACGSRERAVAAGGPEVMTRAELFETFAAGRRVVRVPWWVARGGSAVLRLAHPRLGQLGQFASYLARYDVVAPAVGVSRLGDYLAAT
jgi:uncharacterized protein YbjT (DUF2867 family)